MSHVWEDNEFIYIGNSRIEVLFSKKMNFSIYSISDKDHGIELVKDKSQAVTLWSIVPLAEDKIGEPITNLNSDSERISYVLGHKENTVIMRWEAAFYRERLLNIGVTVTVSVTGDKNDIDWRIKIKNQEKLCIVKVFFPLISGITKLANDSRHDRLVPPHPIGYLVEDPWNTLQADGDGWRDTDFTSTYPGLNGIQLLCFYKEGVGGFYLTTRDDQGRSKGYYFLRKKNEFANCFNMAILHYPDLVKYGNDIEQPYSLKIGVFEGNWEDAASGYRQWAQKQRWCSQGTLGENENLPAWISKIGYAIFLHDRKFPLKKVESWIKVLNARSNLPFILCWFDWRKVLVQGKYPNIKRIVKTAHAHNCYVHFYANAKGWFEGFGIEPREHIAVDWWGNPYVDINRYWSSFVMCPATKYWRERLWKRWNWLADQGIDGIYVDQVGCNPAVACFNRAHDHGPEYNSWWVKKIHELCNETDNRLLWGTEWQSEPYIDIFQFNWFWEVGALPVWGVLPMFTKKARIIPLFNYIYHEYNATLGNPVPNAGGVITRLSRFSFDEYDDFNLAYDFISGKVPAMHVEALEKSDPLRLDYLIELGNLRAGHLNPYLFYGKMLKNLNITVERSNVKMASKHQFAPPLPGMRLYGVPNVLFSTWKALDGSSAIIFINWQNINNYAKLMFTPSDLQMESPCSLYLLKESSFNQLKPDRNNEITLNLQFKPYSVQAVIAKNV